MSPPSPSRLRAAARQRPPSSAGYVVRRAPANETPASGLPRPGARPSRLSSAVEAVEPSPVEPVEPLGQWVSLNFRFGRIVCIHRTAGTGGF